MTTMTGKTLTAQGEVIVSAIKAGLAAMTPERWREESAKAAESDDAGEWFAPEFEAARKATEGISWEFAGWREALDCIIAGYGRLGGVWLILSWPDIVNEKFHSTTEQVADFRGTWPNGNDPDGETQVVVNVHGSVEAGGFVLVLDDNESGGSPRDAGEDVYATFDAAKSAGIAYAEAHDEISLPYNVLARWDAADWDEDTMTASRYKYYADGQPIELTESQAAMYAWGQCEDEITGGCQAGSLRA